MKAKIKERRCLLEEKETIPALQVFRHRGLAQKIAGLTEDIEELKSGEALLLNQFNCADDHVMDETKQHIAYFTRSFKMLVDTDSPDFKRPVAKMLIPPFT